MALRFHPFSEIGIMRAGGLTTDPLGFLAGDANLYRYVGNNPTNNTDPSGLQADKPEYERMGGDKVELKNNSFFYRQGTLAINAWINATFQDQNKQLSTTTPAIWIEAKSTVASVAPLEVLQIVYRYQIDRKTNKELNVPGLVYPVLHNAPLVGPPAAENHLWHEIGKNKWNVDASHSFSPFYTGIPMKQGGAFHVRTDKTLSVADWPLLVRDDNANEIGFVAETYFIDTTTGEPLYRVRWSLVRVFDAAAAEWKPFRWDVSGDRVAPGDLPPYLKRAILVNGAFKRDDLKSREIYLNPIAEKYR